MGARNKVTEDVRQKILMEREQGESWRQIAKDTGLPVSTVRSAWEAKQKEPCAETIARKKEQVTGDIIAYMESQTPQIETILGKMLQRLNEDERLDAATLPQITTAMGTLLDKFLLVKDYAGKSGTESAGGVVFMPSVMPEDKREDDGEVVT